MQNTCIEFANSVDPGFFSLIYYSHLIPVVIALILVFFTLTKTRFSLIAKIFSVFVAGFSLWLISDLLVWISSDYNLISFVWAPLDYINILFFLSGVYFFVVFLNEEDISIWQKLFLFILLLPSWWLTISGQSIHGFDQPLCESFNNEWLTQYKLVVEIISTILIVFYGVLKFIKGNVAKRKQVVIVGFAMLLFFTVFSVTEYISSTTGIYEINLYSLFVLPLFLFMIIYSIVNLETFNLRLIGTQLLAYLLIIMVGSQFFFIENSTNKVLTVITFLLSLGFAILLIRSDQREVKARQKIERLAEELLRVNNKLRDLDLLKSEFLSFASHQLRSPLTAINGYASMLLEGTFGPISDEVKNSIEIMDQSSKSLIRIVGEFLDISRIEQGGMKYTFSDFDFKELVLEVFNELRPNAEKKGFEVYEFSNSDDKDFMVNGDVGKIKQIVGNFLDNSIKYTPKGGVKVRVERKNGKITVSVKDTGIGISKETLPRLFAKFSRAKDASKTNVSGTGLGLFVAKKMIEANNGKVWVESEGEGKGSTFFIELNAKNA
ncbi:MAG: HAMP domain-containing sensor histidine kinase [Candidatus Pacebacteria bacterium]|nr:HAMP domain-containing sensor histidine kinase [Candidatus Paceibacterota bacterium]